MRRQKKGETERQGKSENREREEEEGGERERGRRGQERRERGKPAAALATTFFHMLSGDSFEREPEETAPDTSAHTLKSH